MQHMLIKKERQRPKIGDIKKNAWVTNRGECPMIPTSINCWKQTVTQEEVDTAVTAVYLPSKVTEFNFRYWKASREKPENPKNHPSEELA